MGVSLSSGGGGEAKGIWREEKRSGARWTRRKDKKKKRKRRSGEKMEMEMEMEE
ncbi:uncharacterized protein PADG_11665 [Paracoccidioides brasiliensis Pb18]|uniref:Uncharacterized protein n=1 Tax=Paracoccidioides brasiliensis (strain Pb18) TaxID=502780 RepID=A0A0A0HSE3_PARBD|nr:uncharacterized protein PADG_11665 [Paracoccidioides brasiliensis Pb18]KGM92129.1 hypothetical protein PADG_11665 [Paracoccidioides brasiliensis Pb18]